MIPMVSDTSDMLAVHNVFRDAMPQAPSLIGGVADGDQERAALVASYYDNVLRFLAVHHEGEDVLLWPKLLERLPEHADTINEVASQHEDVHATVDAAISAVAAWGAAADSAAGAVASNAVLAVGDALFLHLTQEENEILPLCPLALTVQEWGEFPQHGTQHFTGDKMWLVLGLIRDHMTSEQRDAMLEHMPPPAAEFWTTAGESMYRGFIEQLHR